MHWPKLRDYAITVRYLQLSALTTFSYTVDWVVYSTATIILLSYASVITPNYHEFLLTDITLMYRYKTEDEITINSTALVSISVLIPIAAIVLLTFSQPHVSRHRKLWDVFTGLLSLCGSMATQLCVVQLLKNVCGMPRPDLISRCIPGPIPEPSYSLSTVEVCTNGDVRVLMDGFRSFPSGHLSTVFCGMILTTLNICGKLQVFDNRGFSLNLVSAVFPLILACYVACTRVSDNRHFLRDVAVGAIIGSLTSIWFYYQYFPSIMDLKNRGRAYPPRRFGISKFFQHVGGFWSIDDDVGAFNEREVNSLEGINRLIGNSGEPLESLDLSTNLEFVQRYIT